MQSRFTMRNHYTPTSRAKIKMTDNIKYWRGVKRLQLPYTAVRNTIYIICTIYIIYIYYIKYYKYCC